MKQTALIQLITFSAMSTLMSGMVAAADFITNGPVPETPDATYAEMVACLAEKGAFKMPQSTQEAAKEDCMAKAKGLTVFEFLAIGSGCLMIDDRNTQTHCMTVDEKLRSQFVKGGPPLSVAGLTAAEIVAIESGCPSITDGTEKARCLSGVNKLKFLLLGATGQPPVSHKDLPFGPPTADEYLAWVKAAPIWINAPRGNALWLMDPLGQLVRDKNGNPVAVPLNKPSPTH